MSGYLNFSRAIEILIWIAQMGYSWKIISAQTDRMPYLTRLEHLKKVSIPLKKHYLCFK